MSKKPVPLVDRQVRPLRRGGRLLDLRGGCLPLDLPGAEPGQWLDAVAVSQDVTRQARLAFFYLRARADGYG